MKKCPICNIEFSDEAEYCPKGKAPGGFGQTENDL